MAKVASSLDDITFVDLYADDPHHDIDVVKAEFSSIGSSLGASRISSPIAVLSISESWPRTVAMSVARPRYTS